MKNFLLSLCVLFCIAKTFGQTYLISDAGTVTGCSGTFTDSGDSTGNYSDNQSFTKTFTATAGAQIRLTFSSFQTQAGADVLFIYDGTNTAAPLLGTYTGSSSPGAVTSTSGSLTFRFVSNSSGVQAGWVAALSCLGVVPSCTPVVTIISNPSPACGGQAVTYTPVISNGGANPTYAWQVNGTTVSTASTYTGTHNKTTLVRLIVTNSSCTQPADTSNIITVQSCDTPLTVNAPDVVICAGAPAMFTATALGGTGNYTYTWSPATALSCTNCQNPVTSSTISRTYTVTVSDGVTTATDQAFVSVITVVPSINIYTTPVACDSQLMTYSIGYGAGGVTPIFQWQANGVNVGNNTSGYTGAHPAGTQIRVIMTTAPSACTSPKVATSNTVVVQNCTPSLSVNAGTDDVVCKGSSAVLSATGGYGTGNYTYTWGPAGTLSCTSCQSPTATPLVTTTYTVTVSDGVSTRTDNVRVNVVDTVPAYVTISSIPYPVCSGQPVTFITNNINGGFDASYEWLVNGSSVATGSNYSASNLPAGSTVQAVLTPDGCPSTPTVSSNIITVSACGNGVCTPNPNAIAPGFYPPSDLIPCVVQTQPYATTVSFRNVSTVYYPPAGQSFAVDSVRIDSITNMPCNLAWKSNKAPGNSTYTANELGCINFYGTSGDQEGQYKLKMYATAFVTVPGVGQVQVAVTEANLGMQVDLRMKSSFAAACASIDTSLAGLTACVDTQVLNAIISGNATICAGSSTVLSVVPSGGTGVYTYSWNPQTGISCRSCPVTTAAPLTTTTYIVDIRNGNTSITRQFTVIVNPVVQPAVTISSSPATVCAGQSATYTPTVTNGGTTPTYQWQVNGATVSTGSSYTGVNSFGSEVRVIVTGNAACSLPAMDTSNSIVTQNCTNTLSASAGSDATICAGSRKVLLATASGGTGSYTYTWSPATGLSCTTCASPNATPADTTTYTVTISDGVDTVSDQVVVYIQPLAEPEITITANPSSACAGTAVIYTATTVNGGANPVFLWQLNGANTSTANSYTTSNIAGSEVKAILTSNAACISQPRDTSNSIFIQNCTGALSVSAGSNVSICSNSGAVLTAIATGGTGNYTYTWSTPNNLIGTLSCLPCQSTIATPPVQTASYSVTVSDGVSTATDEVLVTVTGPVTPTVAINTNPAPPCAGEPVAYTLTAANAGTGPLYEWQVDGATVATGSTFTSLENAGSAVSVILTSNAGCITQLKDTSTIVVQNCTAVPLTVNAGNDTIICSGSTIQLSAIASGGTGNYTYVWSPINNFSCATCPSPKVTQFSNTVTYTVIVSDGVNTVSDQVVVAISIFYRPTVTIGSDPSFACAGQAAVYTPTVINAGTNPSYVWQVNGANVSTARVYTGTNTAGSTIKLIVTSSEPCAAGGSDTSNAITVPVCTVPLSVNAGADIDVCTGSSALLSATAAGGSGIYTYTWSPATNLSCTACQAATVTPGATRTYTVTVSDGINTATDQIMVTLHNYVAPDVTINANPSPACNGQQVTYSAAVINGGTNPTYVWQVNGSNVSTGSIYTASNITGSQVRLILTSNDICISAFNDTSNVITVDICTTALSVNAGPDTIVCLGSSTTLSATASGGTGTYIYSWSPATNLSCTACQSPVATPTTTRTYTVTVSDGLTNTTDQVTVTTQSRLTPSVTISSNPATPCANQLLTFTATPVNGGNSPSYQWWVNGNNVATGSTYSSSSLSTGSTVQVVLAPSGCVTTASVNSNIINIVNCANTIVVSATTADADICTGESSSISVAATGGAGNYTYAWSSNAPCASCTTMTVSPLTTTTYSVTVSDGFATATGSVTINVIPVPATGVSIASTPTPPCAGQPATFSTTSINAGVSPLYFWQVNASPVSTDSTYTSSGLITGDSVVVVMISSEACAEPSVSNVIIVSACTIPLAVSVAGDDTICNGSSTALNTVASGGTGIYSYSWSPPGGLSATNIANPIASPTVTTTYTVAVIDGADISTDTIRIVVISNPVADAGLNDTICPGGDVTLTATGGSSFLWTPSAGLSCTTCSSPVASPAVTTVYSVEVAGNGCTATDDVTVVVSSSATASVSIDAGTDSVCAATPVTFIATPSNGGIPTYQWLIDGQNAGTGNSLTIDTLEAGEELTVVMTSSLACVTNATVVSNAISVQECVSIEQLQWAQALTVYPNPANDKLFIGLSGIEHQQVFFELLNIHGQRMRIGYIQPGTNEMAIGHLASGIYLLKLRADKGVATRKIVIER